MIMITEEAERLVIDILTGIVTDEELRRKHKVEQYVIYGRLYHLKKKNLIIGESGSYAYTGVQYRVGKHARVHKKSQRGAESKDWSALDAWLFRPTAADSTE